MPSGARDGNTKVTSERSSSKFSKTTGSRKRAAGDSSCRGKWATWQVRELLGMGSICFSDRIGQICSLLVYEEFEVNGPFRNMTKVRHNEGMEIAITTAKAVCFMNWPQVLARAVHYPPSRT